MKFWKKILASAPALLVIGTLGTAAVTSCSMSKLPTISSVEIVNAPINDVESGTGLWRSLPISKNPNVYHFNGSKVGCINVADFANLLMDSGDVKWTAKNEDYQTIITNNHTKATCTVDYWKQVIVFSDYDGFILNSSEITNPLELAIVGGTQYFQHTTAKYYANEYTINLSKYNIKGYWYKNEGYLPYDVIANIIDESHENNYFYNGAAFYHLVPSGVVYAPSLLPPIQNDKVLKSSEYMEYTYNLLALTLDTKYGMKQRTLRSTNKIKKYFENGHAYDVIAPYHDYLVSTEPNISDKAMRWIMCNVLNDGGHTGYYTTNVHTPETAISQSDFLDPDYIHVNEMRSFLTGQRAVRGLAPNQKSPLGDSAHGYYEEYEYTVDSNKQKVAYITLDSFPHASGYASPEEEQSKRLLPAWTNELNSSLNPVRLVMYANNKIQEDHSSSGPNEIKNLVIDLSRNTGGTTWTEHFVASWLCKGVTQKVCNSRTGNYTEYTTHADVNGDGVIDSKDYLPEDIRLWVISSNGTFSAGNMLTNNIHDFRPNSLFIGQASGGGACVVQQQLTTGLWSHFRCSSHWCFLTNASTINNRISNDDGVKPDFPVNEENLARIYDRDDINKKILGIE